MIFLLFRVFNGPRQRLKNQVAGCGAGINVTDASFPQVAGTTAARLERHRVAHTPFSRTERSQHDGMQIAAIFQHRLRGHHCGRPNIDHSLVAGGSPPALDDAIAPGRQHLRIFEYEYFQSDRLRRFLEQEKIVPIGYREVRAAVHDFGRG